jgi:hypothetical protein
MGARVATANRLGFSEPGGHTSVKPMPTSHSKSVLPKSISPNSDDPGISQDSMEIFGFEFRLYIRTGKIQKVWKSKRHQQSSELTRRINDEHKENSASYHRHNGGRAVCGRM